MVDDARRMTDDGCQMIDDRCWMTDYEWLKAFGKIREIMRYMIF